MAQRPRDLKTSAEGRRFIEAFERLELKAYKDSQGVWTIGYGHTAAAGRVRVYPGMVCSEWEADQWLSDDLGRVEGTVTHCIHVPLKQYEFDSLVSFEFNTGDLQKSSIDDKINEGRKEAAMDTLLLYVHGAVDHKKLRGLVRRRRGERAMFEGNVNEALEIANE